ncbi:hypothetical protein [Aeropyrum camini]|uniref:hypothetical protein n=1 Tax=Aeropyrum camini TaxID=229980 RepID=UPI00210EFBEF|nr:hypothetical protein [Aeropyrum camini]
MESVIEVERLVKRYGSVEALRDVSFSVLSGGGFRLSWAKWGWEDDDYKDYNGAFQAY